MPTQPYTEFKYLYPPRPASKIPFDLSSPVFRSWAKQPDSVAQLKLNGSRNLIFIAPNDDIEMWNRHKEKHRSYTAPKSLLDLIRDLPYPKGVWNVLDSELMHLKTPTVKDTVYFYDALVWGGEYLLGKTYTERYPLIQGFNLPPFPLEKQSISGKLFIAQNYAPDQWEPVWNAAKTNDVLEGLVIKRIGNVSALQPGFREENNGGWMCRVRKSHKNYQF